ncbi:MAG TPA: hypothetical protein VMG12_06505 [Polyangiaceae bacterium]|nr:hypothetical protein [Polyangiaceae bacterium]
MRRRAALKRAWCAAVLLGSSGAGWVWVPSAASAAEAAPDAAWAPHYSVVDGCPQPEAWVEALAARLPASLQAHPALERLTIEVTRAGAVGSDGKRFTGELGSVGGDASEARRVSGASCTEVVQALALIAALEVQRAAEATAPALASATAAASNESTPPALPDDSPPHGVDWRDAQRPRLGAVAFALLQSGRAPHWTADTGVGVALEWSTESWQPWLMLGVTWGADDVAVGHGAQARFTRWAAHVVGSPLRFPRDTALGVRPCASLELGRISGEGERVSDAAESAALLASAALDVRLEWSILEHLELAALFGGALALSRPRFYFSPEFTALDVAAGGLRTGGSASLSF